MTTTLTGHEAIEYATKHGLTLSKYADPVEDARDGLTAEEAEEIAAEDPSLVWVERVVGAILVHGLTGQDLAEEWLAAGTACEVEEEDEEWATVLVDGYRYRVLPSDLAHLSVQA